MNQKIDHILKMFHQYWRVKWGTYNGRRWYADGLAWLETLTLKRS